MRSLSALYTASPKCASSKGLRLPFQALGYDELYDVLADPSESYSVAAQHRQAVADLKTRLARAAAEFAAFKHTDMSVFKWLRQSLEHMQD